MASRGLRYSMTMKLKWVTRPAHGHSNRQACGVTEGFLSLGKMGHCCNEIHTWVEKSVEDTYNHNNTLRNIWEGYQVADRTLKLLQQLRTDGLRQPPDVKCSILLLRLLLLTFQACHWNMTGQRMVWHKIFDLTLIQFFWPEVSSGTWARGKKAQQDVATSLLHAPTNANAPL